MKILSLSRGALVAKDSAHVDGLPAEPVTFCVLEYPSPVA